MRLQTITEILKNAIRPNKVKYTLLHESTKAPTASKAKITR